MNAVGIEEKKKENKHPEERIEDARRVGRRENHEASTSITCPANECIRLHHTPDVSGDVKTEDIVCSKYPV